MKDKVSPEINSCVASGEITSLKEMLGGTAFMNLRQTASKSVYRYIPCLLIKEVAEYAAMELSVGDRVIVTGKLDNWKTAGQKLKNMIIKVNKISIVGKGEMPHEVDVDQDL